MRECIVRICTQKTTIEKDNAATITTLSNLICKYVNCFLFEWENKQMFNFPACELRIFGWRGNDYPYWRIACVTASPTAHTSYISSTLQPFKACLAYVIASI